MEENKKVTEKESETIQEKIEEKDNKNTQDSEDHIIQLKNGRNVCYRIYGDKNGSPLLYFHGMFGSRFENYFDFDHFGTKYQQKVYIMDRFGYGKSDPLLDVSLKNICASVIEFVEKLEIERFNVIGYSNGGIIALGLLYHFPQRLNNVFILSCSSPDTQITLGASVKIMEIFSKYSQWIVKLICYFTSSLLTSQPEKWVDYMMSEEVDIGKKLMKENYEMIKKNYSVGVSKYDAVSNDFIVGNNDFGFKIKEIDLKSFKGKVYIVCGDKDNLEPEQNVENLSAHLKDSNFIVYKDHSHYLFSKENCDDIMKRISVEVKFSLEEEIKVE